MTADEFLRKCAECDGRIVCSNDLNRFQLSEAQSNRAFYVDESTGYGFAILPWELTTDKDRGRESKYFFVDWAPTA